MSLRIAIGRCNCQKPYRDSIQAKACEEIEARLRHWRERLPADLSSIPAKYFELERIEGHWITFGTHKHVLEAGVTLVVFQALVHTWSRPTFFSLGSVGRMYAEGMLVSAEGQLDDAPDQMMWSFR